MPWNPRDSVLKVQMLELFARFGELKPAEYAELAGWRPRHQAWAYLKRHHRRGMLKRRRDHRGRLVYSIGQSGARYLLWWKQQYPDAKVPT